MFWGKNKNIIAALEVGSTKIVTAVGEIRSDGTLALLGIGETASAQVRKCEVVDFELAQACIRDALSQLEHKTDVVIGEVYLAISGAHLRSSNVRVSIPIPPIDDISEDFLDELEEMAVNQPIPADHAVLHNLLQYYILDDGTITDNPVGLASTSLLATYHKVFGLATRLQTTIRCVKELGVDVKSCALSSYATAQAVLTKAQKKVGAVVINLGGGVSDYILYERGAVIHSGVLGVGGEHLTSDLVSGLKLPYAKAEELKKMHGSVILDPRLKDDTILMPGSYNFEERSIYRESLNIILQARQAEIFEIVLEDLQNIPQWKQFGGHVYLTGGGSQIPGLLELAEHIFPVPVELAHQSPFDGDQTYARRPDLSTVLGLLHYGRQVELASLPTRGLARVSQSIRDVIGSMRIF